MDMEKLNMLVFQKIIEEKYQCFTKANMNKLLNKGFRQKFYSINDALK